MLIKILELLKESTQTNAKLFKVEINGEVTIAKQCGECGEIKTLDKFHVDRDAMGGVHTKCKECRSTNTMRKIVKIKIDNGEVDAKDCSKCGKVKPLTDFAKGNGVGGRHPTCKKCRSVYHFNNREKENARNRQWAKNNPDKTKNANRLYYIKNKKRISKINKQWQLDNEDKARIYRQKYYIENKEKHNLQMKKWHEENKEYHFYLNKINGIKRRAIEMNLRGEFIPQDSEKLRNYFSNNCALSDETDNIQIDHFIPLSIGHGGTYIGNLIPLSERLNRSKFNKNPFEWIKEDMIINIIDKKKWEYAIEYLANENEISVSEYEDFVYWCFDHKRSLEDLKEDNTSSIELWNTEKRVMHNE